MNTEGVRTVFDHMRATLTAHGISEPTITTSVADQVQASFRHDLLGMRLDPASEDVVLGALGGLAIGMRILVQNGGNPMLLAVYTTVCEMFLSGAERNFTTVGAPSDLESLLAAITPPTVDLEPKSDDVQPQSDDEDVRCTSCTAPAVVMFGEVPLCLSCLAARAMAADTAQPQIGGPGFVRTESPPPVVERDPTAADVANVAVRYLRSIIKRRGNG